MSSSVVILSAPARLPRLLLQHRNAVPQQPWQRPRMTPHRRSIWGCTSYTFRNFDRAQLIGFMKQLNVLALNAKDVKDHLPVDPAGEAKALNNSLPPAFGFMRWGTVYFPKDEI